MCGTGDLHLLETPLLELAHEVAGPIVCGRDSRTGSASNRQRRGCVRASLLSLASQMGPAKRGGASSRRRSDSLCGLPGAVSAEPRSWRSAFRSRVDGLGSAFGRVCTKMASHCHAPALDGTGTLTLRTAARYDGSSLRQVVRILQQCPPGWP